MRSKMFVPTLCATLFAGLVTSSIPAQEAGPVAFDITQAALFGTVACNGGQPSSVAPVDASTTDVNGSNDAIASNLSAAACGLPFYSIQSANDASSASDTSSSDQAEGTGAIQQVSVLGGILAFQTKSESNLCSGASTGNIATINCQDSTQIQNLVFAGQSITGTFTQPTTFPAVGVQIQIPGYCTGVALFTGNLTINSSSQQQNANTGTLTLAPLELKGTLSCIGLPLTSETVDLEDEDLIEYALLVAMQKLSITASQATIAGIFQAASR